MVEVDQDFFFNVAKMAVQEMIGRDLGVIYSFVYYFI